MSIAKKHRELCETFHRIHSALEKYEDMGATTSALFRRFDPCDPTKLMRFVGSGNVNPAGEGFAKMFAFEKKEHARLMANCLVQAVKRLQLKPEREEGLFSDIIAVLVDSRSSQEPGVVVAINKFCHFVADPAKIDQAAKVA